jgi:hypothetical protein
MNLLDIFENDDDLFAAPQAPGKYWNNTPQTFKDLWAQLVPGSGSAETLEGEMLRAANRLYYDYYNNGFGNNTSGAENFLRNFGGGNPRLLQALDVLHPYTRGIMPDRSEEPDIEKALDIMMDIVVYHIVSQQGNYHPNTAGDLFDYSQSDDPYPEDDDEDYETGYEDDDEEEDDVYENADDDMFAPASMPPGGQRQIYHYGLNLLHTLEERGRRALENPQFKQAVDQAGDEQDADQLFNFVLELTGASFKKAMVVDTLLREFTGMEGLNDFGWMLESDGLGDLYTAWDSFAQDKEILKDPAFLSDVREFFKDDVNESEDGMFASHLDRILSKFTFPEDGPLGFMLGGGGFSDDSFGGYTDGITIVNPENNQIAFIPDFTYFDEDPTQEELGELFYDETPGFETKHLPITGQTVQKFLGINEAEVELDEPPAPERKQQTKTKAKFNYDPFKQQQDQPLAQRPEEPKSKSAGPKQSFRKASAAGTANATRNVNIPAQGHDYLRNLNIEIDPDLAPYPDEEPRLDISTEVNTENLPAVAGEAIAAAGMTSPEFHQVARLPGNMSAMIRQLGKKLFGSMTSTPTEQIYMIGNLGGQGPNTRQEVNAVANFVRENGDDMGPGDIDFDAIMPGYQAKTHQYVAAGIRWLLVKDFAGEYIYAWPEADSTTPSSQARLGNAPKQLSEEEDMFAHSEKGKHLVDASKWRRGGEVSGTGLKGYVVTTYDQILKTFGEPIYEGGDKVPVEWVITFKDGKVATIYVYRMDHIPKEEYRWHVGGRDRVVVDRVAALLHARPAGDLMQESVTPEGEFLDKAGRVKHGDEIVWKGKVVGLATGEVHGNRIFFNPDPKVLGKNMVGIASLPIDQVYIK